MPFVYRPFTGALEETPESYVGNPDIEITREWEGERCFIIGNGESVTPDRHLIAGLKGRVIAIKLSAALRPDADVMFISGKRAYEICEPMFTTFTGKYAITRGRGDARFPRRVWRIGRTKAVDRVCTDPKYVAGLDAGTSAINLAYHFGAKEIVLIGFDYCGARWSNGEFAHFTHAPGAKEHRLHLQVAELFGQSMKETGVHVVNTSKHSRLQCYEKRSLESFI